MTIYVINLWCAFVCVIYQIQYNGGKHYRDAEGVVLKLTDAKGEVVISKGDQSVEIDSLVPMTPYTFNIRARFSDGTWGPRSTVQSETIADGMFDDVSVMLTDYFL